MFSFCVETTTTTTKKYRFGAITRVSEWWQNFCLCLNYWFIPLRQLCSRRQTIYFALDPFVTHLGHVLKWKSIIHLTTSKHNSSQIWDHKSPVMMMMMMSQTDRKISSRESKFSPSSPSLWPEHTPICPAGCVGPVQWCCLDPQASWAKSAAHAEQVACKFPPWIPMYCRAPANTQTHRVYRPLDIRVSDIRENWKCFLHWSVEIRVWKVYKSPFCWKRFYRTFIQLNEAKENVNVV